MRREHVDLERQLIHVPIAKTGSRDVPISQNLKGFLDGYLQSLTPGKAWLFPSSSARSGHTSTLVKPWRRIISSAGLTGRNLTRHTLRHTAITHLVQAAVDLPTVQKVSGHKSFQMVCQYSHQNQEHVQQALSKLDSRIVVKTPDQAKTKSTSVTTQDLHSRHEALSFTWPKSLEIGWARLDSNQRPKDYESSALTD